MAFFASHPGRHDMIIEFAMSPFMVWFLPSMIESVREPVGNNG